MKKIYTLVFTIVALTSYAQTSDLFFSMYGEGSSNNKFLEIYNGTGADVDLSNYSLSTCSNGCDTANEFDYPDTLTFTAGTMLANGDVYVIAHPSADATILAAADVTFNFLSNGDDAMALTAAGATASSYTIIDILGDLSDVDGDGWDVAGVTNATYNHTFTRKTTVCDPNPNPLGSFGTDATDSEWVVGASNSGWGNIGSYTGCVTDPVLNILSPTNNQVLASGTTSVDVTIDVQNFVVGNTTGAGVDGHIHWTVDSGSGAVTQPMKYNTNAETISVTDGGSYTVYMELVDNSHTPISPAVNATVSFTVAYPCDLQIGAIATTCDAETSGVDTYTTTLDFTGGGTSQYTIDTEGNGTVGGDDPSSVATGTITITGVNEGTNFTVTFTGDPTDSSCNFTRNITSPACIGAVVCANVGDIIVTEIMQNPSAVADSAGEYFEVYNTTSSAINMQGWTLDGGAHTISALTVPANGYAVLGINSDTASNGGVPVDYQYSSVFLGNGTDSISIECSGTVIDQVAWDDGATFPDPNGASMELDASAYNNTDNDNGANWGAATASYGDGDLGTPGAANSFNLSVEEFGNTGFSIYPNPTNTGLITINTNNSNPVNVTIYSVTGQLVLSHKISNNTLNVSTLKSGVYLLQLAQNNAVTTKKLIIK